MQDYLHIGRASDLALPKDRRLYRFLEILPGLLAWTTLILIPVLSLLIPVYIAVFIIVFDVYWLLKTIYLSTLMRAAFVQMRANLKIDWIEKLKQARPIPNDLTGVKWEELYHVVIFPMYREPLEIVRASFESLVKAKYPLEKFIVVLALESRAGDEHNKHITNEIQSEFGDSFFRLLITRHPDGLPGEMAGKGSNEAWAGRQLKEEIIDPLGLAHEKVIVSVFDIDTVVPPDFFACLAYNYLTTPKPLRSSYQPIPIFTNNIWDTPAFARVFAFSNTFWQMIQQSRPDQLVTFSSQSIGFKALVDIGFWQGNMVSEDSRIYWQCLLRYDGDWRTIPLHFPVYMDANMAPTFWATLVNQYKQIRRWLYGVENLPYFIFGFIKNKNISRGARIKRALFEIERSHSNSTNSLIIFFLGWLPVLIGGAAFNQTVLSFNLPVLTRYIMTIAMLGLITSAVVTIMLLPPRPPYHKRYRWLFMVIQWLLFPINFIFFGALPALESQTRLMLGRYLGFWVTPKIRSEPKASGGSQEKQV